MGRLNDLQIRNFKSDDQDYIKRMVLAGLVEHWRVLDPNKNSDLNNISANYQNGIFLVAEIGTLIVGCGGMKFNSSTTAEIVRIATLSTYRRMGIGTKILDMLVNKAFELGYQEVILETTATWSKAILFYQKNGFRISHSAGDDLYFIKRLKEHDFDKKV